MELGLGDGAGSEEGGSLRGGASEGRGGESKLRH